MNTCFFVSDLHGVLNRYEALFKVIKKEKPDFVFLGGDLLPHTSSYQSKSPDEENSFIKDYLIRKFSALKETMECAYPEVYLIPGNDDQRFLFLDISEGEKADLWRNLHNQCIVIGKYRFYGYACVPPTPFLIKDWDRFDISKQVKPGCIAPADGYHSTPPDYDPENDTMQNDIALLVNQDSMEFSVFLFHSPPYNTFLDHVSAFDKDSALQMQSIHVGSEAIRMFIDEKQPYITMHGHIHESARITGQWKQSLGKTVSFTAAHDGPELALVKFDLHDPASATRRLINT